MDRIIAGFAAEPDGDLMLCIAEGVAWQRDMSVSAAYDETYFNKCASYEGKEIALAINTGRVALVRKHFGDGPLLDVGIGSGEFIRERGDLTYGFDVNPKAIAWLKRRGDWSDDFEEFKAFTFWDVIEHVEEPEAYFRRMSPGSFLFTCLPIFVDLQRIRESKHYRPGEHLYYWTEKGFADWMALHRFRLLETRRFETEAGRDSILSFAFRRDLAG